MTRRQEIVRRIGAAFMIYTGEAGSKRCVFGTEKEFRPTIAICFLIECLIDTSRVINDKGKFAEISVFAAEIAYLGVLSEAVDEFPRHRVGVNKDDWKFGVVAETTKLIGPISDISPVGPENGRCEAPGLDELDGVAVREDE